MPIFNLITTLRMLTNLDSILQMRSPFSDLRQLEFRCFALSMLWRSLQKIKILFTSNYKIYLWYCWCFFSIEIEYSPNNLEITSGKKWNSVDDIRIEIDIVVPDDIEYVIKERLDNNHIECAIRFKRITLKQTQSIPNLIVEVDIVDSE
jgi:hypothetical protein